MWIVNTLAVILSFISTFCFSVLVSSWFLTNAPISFFLTHNTHNNGTAGFRNERCIFLASKHRPWINKRAFARTCALWRYSILTIINLYRDRMLIVTPFKTSNLVLAWIQTFQCLFHSIYIQTRHSTHLYLAAMTLSPGYPFHNNSNSLLLHPRLRPACLTMKKGRHFQTFSIRFLEIKT